MTPLIFIIGGAVVFMTVIAVLSLCTVAARADRHDGRQIAADNYDRIARAKRLHPSNWDDAA